MTKLSLSIPVDYVRRTVRGDCRSLPVELVYETIVVYLGGKLYPKSVEAHDQKCSTVFWS